MADISTSSASTTRCTAVVQAGSVERLTMAHAEAPEASANRAVRHPGARREASSGGQTDAIRSAAAPMMANPTPAARAMAVTAAC